MTSGIASIDWWRGQNYYDSGDWRGTWELDGGGALMNQGVHTVDLLVATLGRPVEVFAYTGTLAHQRIEVEDVTVGVVRFENGALGAARDHGCVSGSRAHGLQVHGDKGSIVIDNDELTFIHVTPQGSEGEEKAYGSLGSSENQLADFLTETRAAPARVATRPPCPATPIGASTRTFWPRWSARKACASTWRPTDRRSRSSPARTSRPHRSPR